jgi:hypothetical protein
MYLLVCTASVVAVVFSATLARADSTEAYCVLSRHDHTAPIVRGACRWSQRQGNVNILFGHWAFRFDGSEEGRTYSRLNREGDEAGLSGPVFTREGHYTLSIYWHQPGKDSVGQ